jgi:hypothetical protein
MEEGSKETTRRQEGLGEQEWDALGRQVGERCFAFLRPVLQRVDAHVDVRLVRTLANLVPLVIQRRNRSEALLISQLGDELEPDGHGPAGTKRIANLLHSPAWEAEELTAFVEERASEVVDAERAGVREGRALCILDGSVSEKPESAQLAGLAPITSAKARRLRRPRPTLGQGYYRGPVGAPTVVPGFHWLSLLVTGWADRAAHRPVGLGGWLWYRRVAKDHPEHAALTAEIPTADLLTAACSLLRAFVERIGAEKLLFVGDREFASAFWLGTLVDLHLPFVVRWKKGNHLRAEDVPSVDDPLASLTQQRNEARAAWRLTQKLLFRQTHTLANPRKPTQPLTVRFGARPVRLVGSDEPLWLVHVQLGRGGRRRRDGEPWRLLTNLPLATYSDVWRVVEAYAARWQIEQMVRFSKAELGIESIRVRAWKPRARLLAIISLAYAFLVHLLADASSPLVAATLQLIHRTGQQANGAWRPLYRFRQALAALWKRHTPTFQGVP